MRKRVISLLLAFVMVISLTPAALAAPEEQPPYSLKYLDGITGVEYVEYIDGTDDGQESISSSGNAITQITYEFYDVSALSASVGGNWNEIIAPFRKRLVEAGYQESVFVDVSQQPEYSEPEFYYNSADGDRFVICGKTWTEDRTLKGELVIIWHAHCVEYNVISETSGSLNNFKTVQTYTPGQFKDVKSGVWYEKTVQSAFELGLVKGSGAGAFSPDNNITIAEALVLACRIHNIYCGGTGEFTQGNPWYQVYVDYAIEQGIIAEDSFNDYTAPATREEFASIMYCSLPEAAFSPINNVSILDIPDRDDFSGDFYRVSALWLYNAGVLTGSGDGSFKPQDPITRSEVATIVARMAVAANRVKLG